MKKLLVAILTLFFLTRIFFFAFAEPTRFEKNEIIKQVLLSHPIPAAQAVIEDASFVEKNFEKFQAILKQYQAISEANFIESLPDYSPLKKELEKENVDISDIAEKIKATPIPTPEKPKEEIKEG